jgi:hypothetical protein
MSHQKHKVMTSRPFTLEAKLGNVGDETYNQRYDLIKADY